MKPYFCHFPSIRSDLESAQQKEKSLVVELDELKQKAASMDASLQSAQAENDSLKSQIAELSSSSSDDINKLREKVVALETELPVVQSQRDQLLQSESHIQNQLSRAESSNESLKEEIQILKSKNLQLVKDMKTELVKLLDKQKEDATIMEMLKKKVASYSKTVRKFSSFSV
jgi:chromosome segregation ATPase